MDGASSSSDRSRVLAQLMVPFSRIARAEPDGGAGARAGAGHAVHGLHHRLATTAASWASWREALQRRLQTIPAA